MQLGEVEGGDSQQVDAICIAISSYFPSLHDRQIETANNPILRSPACKLKGAFCCKYCQSSGSKARNCFGQFLQWTSNSRSISTNHSLAESWHAIIRLNLFARNWAKLERNQQLLTGENLKYRLNQGFC